MGERIKETAQTYLHDLREVGERVWDAGQRTVHAAGTRAAHYGKRVQRRFDLATVDRKIEEAHRELGRLVFAGLREGRDDVLLRPEVAKLVAELAALYDERIGLAREIETLHAEATSAGGGGTAGGPKKRVPPSESEVGAEEERHL